MRCGESQRLLAKMQSFQRARLMVVQGHDCQNCESASALSMISQQDFRRPFAKRCEQRFREDESNKLELV